jgi:hypothetical protein
MGDMQLEWLSYAGQGHIDDLPGDLAPAARRRFLDSLVMLGHVEMPTPSTWRVAPPCLAELPNGPDGRHAAVLCGARTPGVLGRLSRAREIGTGTLEVSETDDLPSLVKVGCAVRSDLRRIATQAGIPLQDNAGYTLLACIPAVAAWPRQQAPMIAGRVRDVKRFSREQLGWVAATLEEATAAKSGLFRIQREYDWVSLIKLGAGASATIDDRAGRLITAAKLRTVNWHSEAQALQLPTQLIPPAPIARALALCTGRLPSFDRKNRQLTFGGVNAAMLRLTLAITGLRLT